MMMVRVRLAFLERGSRKAVVPLETASTPVMAAQPLEKAFIRSQMSMSGRRIRPVLMGGGGAVIAIGWPPVATTWKTPKPMVSISVPTKRKVGSMKAKPDSLTPRMLTMAMMARMQRQSRS